MNRTRSFVGAAIMVAIIGGCDPSEITNVDVCPDVPGIQLTGPCEEPQPEIGGVTLSFDTPDLKVTQGDSMPCPKVTVVGAKNLPHGYTLDTVLVLNTGTVVACGVLGSNGPQLVSGSPPVRVTTVLSVGSYTVTAKVSLRGTSVKAESQPVPFTVVRKPDLLVFTKVEATYPNNGPSDIWVVDEIPGATPVRLTSTGGNKRASAMSPDGKTLVYVADSKLWRANSDGTNPVEYSLFWNGAKIYPDAPEFSPDGSMLAFTGALAGGNGDVVAFVMNVGGSNLHRILADKRALVPDIAWFPNSQEVAVAYSVIEQFNVVREVYVRVHHQTGETRHIVTIEKGQNEFKSLVVGVSRNGDELLLWSLFTTKQAIIVRTDGSGEVKVLPRTNIYIPVLCSDGEEEKVCFQSGYAQVSSMKKDGTSEEIIFTSDGWIADLSHWARPR